jgi:hypothetical protein
MEMILPDATGDLDSLVREHIPEITGLKVDEVFRDMMPPLSQEEYAQLELDIVEHGCTDPIIIWDGYNIILDGHNRFRICTEHGIEFKTISLKFETREDAEIWIINRQMGRRSLTDSQKSYYRGKRYNIEKKDAHRPKKGGQSDHLKTSEKVAEDSKVSSKTVRRDANYAAAIDCLREDTGQDFVSKILTEEIKLTKGDVKKLAVKPNDERVELIDAIQNGAKNLSQAEAAVLKRSESESGYFERACSDIQFAAWSWNPRNQDAPRNTQAPQEGCEIKERLVWLDTDIFGDDFQEDERVEILRVIRESPQWIFTVHTELPERLEGRDLPANVWVGFIVDSQAKAESVPGTFSEVGAQIKFIVCDLHNESIVFNDLSWFNWMIIRNLSKTQPDWIRVESVLAQASAYSLWTHLMPNITVKPREYPRIQDQVTMSKITEVTSQELVREMA